MKKLLKILISLAIPVVIGAATFLYLSEYILKAVDDDNQEVVYFEVLPSQSLRAIAQELEAENLIRHWRAIDILARLRGVDTKIKAGEYELTRAMTPKEIMSKLASGEVSRRIVVVKEGVSVWEIGSILQSAGLRAADDFNPAMTNFEFLREAGIRAENFEGYLFPDTYHFSKSDTIRTVIWRMLERGDQLWDVRAMKQAEKLRMTRHEILTLASIIEKESGNVSEQNKISSVFHNRLAHGMKLQSDPTVVYGIADYRGVITHEMLLRVHPYNTYINFGLPPGPICNPGESAIKAALNPVDSRFLYFVADGKGEHVFSENLDQHNAAVQRYRQGLEQAKAGGGQPAIVAGTTTPQVAAGSAPQVGVAVVEGAMGASGVSGVQAPAAAGSLPVGTINGGAQPTDTSLPATAQGLNPSTGASAGSSPTAAIQ